MTISISGRKGGPIKITENGRTTEYTPEQLKRNINYSSAPESSQRPESKNKELPAKRTPIRGASSETAKSFPRVDAFTSRVQDALVLMNEPFRVKDGIIKLPSGYKVFDYNKSTGMWEYINSSEVDLGALFARVGRSKEDFKAVEMIKSDPNGKIYQMIFSSGKEKVAFTFDVENRQWGGGFLAKI